MDIKTELLYSFPRLLRAIKMPWSVGAEPGWF